MTRVCVFVDGENLRHTIADLFTRDQFDRRDYLPKAANWADFCDTLVDKATDGSGTRVRTYWYVINDVDPFPFVIRERDRKEDALREWMSKNERLLTRAKLLESLSEGDVTGNLRQLHKDMWNERDKIRRRFGGFQSIQNRIAQSHRAIEFRRSGAIGYNLLTREFGEEKTVDVNLGVDLVLLRRMYDLALIISGDQDYVPAVQATKDFGKHVVNVAFRARTGNLLPGGARRLNDMTDWSIAMEYDDCRGALNLPAH